MKTLIAAVLLAVAAVPAVAQPNCKPRAEVVQHLESRYGESPQSMGMMGNGAYSEMWANLETGTWSFTITRPDGSTCIAVYGQGFERLGAGPAPAAMGVDG